MGLFHGIKECLRLEGALKPIHFLCSCHGQGCQLLNQALDQVAQGSLQPGLEQLQGWGTHSISGQPVPGPHFFLRPLLQRAGSELGDIVTVLTTDLHPWSHDDTCLAGWSISKLMLCCAQIRHSRISGSKTMHMYPGPGVVYNREPKKTAPQHVWETPQPAHAKPPLTARTHLFLAALQLPCSSTMLCSLCVCSVLYGSVLYRLCL